MKTQTYEKRFTNSDLDARLSALIETVANETDAARASGQIARYLAVMGRFHNYSFNNIMLILSQNPNATQVASFNAWRQMGRFVMAGQKGLAIFVPVQVSDKRSPDPDAKITVFKVGYVFDVSQTDGQPLPEAPAWHSAERAQELQARLVKAAQAKGLTVTEAELIRGGAQGMANEGKITLASTSGTMTLIHEMAHHILHIGGPEKVSREMAELEAEAVAAVCGSHWGLATEAAVNYLALWKAEGEAIKARMARIQKAAREIIESAEA